MLTEDRLRLRVSTHVRRAEKRQGWLIPFGILVTILVTLATANFRNFLVPAATWQAVFVISALLATVWLIWSVREALLSESVEDLIESLKRESLTPPNA